ncbi:EAL domain-containing protein [Psychromonas sp. MME2]|uniref:EAL domain-containing protein n=1 Tax=Psychromonas sp. MME2 TaxID=3231033 RepID=UPI00339CE330
MRHCFFYYISILLLFSLSSPASAINNVLFIHSYHGEHGWTSFLKQGFNDAFKDDNDTRLFHEYMDAKRFPNPKEEFRSLFINYLRDKYKNTVIDVLVISDDAALSLIRANRSRFFPEVPIVFLGINRVSEELVNEPNMTGVFENRDIGQTLIDIKNHTGQNHVVVITDQSEAGKANVWKIEQVKNHPESPAKVTIIDDLKDTTITASFQGIGEKIPVLLIGQLVSPALNDALLSWNDGVKAVTDRITNPVYTIAITTLDYGVVGAHELDGRQHAARAALMIKQLLAGVSISDIPAITKAKSRWIFNWENLKNYHHLSTMPLPLNSELINQERTFYQQYKLIVWLVGIAFIVFIIVIILLTEIIRRGIHNRRILLENETRYKDLAHAGANIFWETNVDNCISYLSGDAKLAFGIDSQQMIGNRIDLLFENKKVFDFPWADYNLALARKVALDNLIFKVKSADHDVKVFMVKGKPLFNDKFQYLGYRGIYKEVTHELKLSQQLAYQADYDSLTNLINRSNFNRKLKEVVKEQSGDKVTAFVCFLDLDHFKLVNDTAGHLIGDAMLAEVAQVIANAIGDTDTLGRLGGDEFGLIIKAQQPVEVQSICEMIIRNVSNYKYHWNDRYFDVGVSIGAVPICKGLTATELLSKADLSCYKAKDLGRGRVYIADSSGANLYADELQMGYIANVSQVIEQKRFYLAKQLIKPLDNSTGDAPHYEILIRYCDRNGDMVPPGVFIPAAEKHGVIGLIDNWVLTTIFERYQQFFPDQNTTVSINLSGISLSNQEFFNNVLQLVRNSSIEPQKICFEITETAIISQLSQALEFIHEMKGLGIKFALDDFGSGVSSFGYLKNLPVDYLKIDGSLVKNIVTEKTDLAIVRSINDIAHMMNIKTIAEFVENQEICDLLEEIGVDYVQGYGIEKPVKC